MKVAVIGQTVTIDGFTGVVTKIKNDFLFRLTLTSQDGKMKVFSADKVEKLA